MNSLNLSYLDNSTYSNSNSQQNNSQDEIENLNKTIESLILKINYLEEENSNLKKFNKNLNSKLNFLINDNMIIKNVKSDIQDCSDFTAKSEDDNLKEFFYLVVICEKMKYLNLDHIWMIDSSKLYREVQNLNLAFYEWREYIEKTLKKQNEEFYKIKTFVDKENSVIKKFKDFWINSSLSFFKKIQSLKCSTTRKKLNLNNLNNNTNDSEKWKDKNFELIRKVRGVDDDKKNKICKTIPTEKNDFNLKTNQDNQDSFSDDTNKNTSSKDADKDTDESDNLILDEEKKNIPHKINYNFLI